MRAAIVVLLITVACPADAQALNEMLRSGLRSTFHRAHGLHEEGHLSEQLGQA